MKWWVILILAAVCAVLLYIIFTMAIFYIANKKMMGTRGEDPKNPCYLRFEDYSSTLVREEFVCGYYGKAIRGYIYKDKRAKDSKAFVVLSHGAFGTHIQYLLDISLLAEDGYEVLAYDQYGVGMSDGDKQEYLAHGIYVLENVLHEVEKKNLNHGLPIYLYGHSWGAYSVAGALRNHPEIAKAVVRSAPISPYLAGKDVLKKFSPKTFSLIRPFYGLDYVLLLPRRYRIKATRGPKKNHKTSVLLLQARDDTMVPYADSLARYYELHPQTNVRVFLTEHGKHNTLLAKEGAENYGKLVKEFKEIDKEPTKALRDYNEKQFESTKLSDRKSLYPYEEKTKEEILKFLSGK